MRFVGHRRAQENSAPFYVMIQSFMKFECGADAAGLSCGYCLIVDRLFESNKGYFLLKRAMSCMT